MTVGGVHIINATNFLVRYLLQYSISSYSYSLPEYTTYIKIKLRQWFAYLRIAL